jgi:hypothetical protein
MGADGKHTLTNYDEKTTRKTYEADLSNPLSGQAIGWVNPIAAVIANGDKDKTTQLAGQLTNAVTSNAKDLTMVKANVMGIAAKMGMDGNMFNKRLQDLIKNGTIDPKIGAAYMNGVNSLGLPKVAGNPLNSSSTIFTPPSKAQMDAELQKVKDYQKAMYG